MVDVLLAELVVGQVVLAFLQREGARRHEGEQGATARADRAVALRHGLGDIDVDAVAHRAAMTAAGMDWHWLSLLSRPDLSISRPWHKWLDFVAAELDGLPRAA